MMRVICQDKDQVSVGNGSRYEIVPTRQLHLTRYESVLYVYNTTKRDHGLYRCVASNELGDDSLIIALDSTSQ